MVVTLRRRLIKDCYVSISYYNLTNRLKNRGLFIVWIKQWLFIAKWPCRLWIGRHTFSVEKDVFIHLGLNPPEATFNNITAS